MKPRTEETTIAAVDTSCMKIGETAKGILIAIRGACVWKEKRNHRYLRLGPFVFHVAEEYKEEVYRALRKTYFISPHEHDVDGSPGLFQMPTRIACLLERWLQTMLSKTLTNSVILFDGSLTAGIGDTPVKCMKEILQAARKRGNTILAFSKVTNLRVNGYIITDVPLKHKPPCLLEITVLKRKSPVLFMGDIYVARLKKGKYAFRLDVDNEVSRELRIESIEKLLGNEVFPQGYPETLRLAHIHCTFTANEVIAMQHFATHKFNLKIIDRPNMHKVLFGPFGKGDN